MAKVGRPTEYGEELIKKTKKYFERYLRAHKDGKGVFPSIAELSLELDISRETVYAWSKEEDKKEFSDIIKKILALQELSLHDNGLFGRFNPTITKLMLTKHGYTDKTDVSSDGKPLQPVLVRFLGENEPKDN